MQKSALHCSRHHRYQAEQALLQLISDSEINHRNAMEKAGRLPQEYRKVNYN